ncbi:MAG: signal peptidase II [Crocinitomicaceae bacterium]|nr:signal peptidase II [Crocinitomicaceae bacterium]
MNKNNLVKRNLLIVAGIIFFILVVDQLLKIYVKTHFQLGETHPILGNWFVMEYIENRGMAFGTSFGNKAWHKLALSIFRIVAVIAMIYYWIKKSKEGMKLGFLIPFGLIIAGAMGNLLDSMYFDYYFKYDPCFPYNIQEGSGIWVDCDVWGFVEKLETKPRGFLFGNVVDMFKFDATWPKGMPYVGGDQIFPAIWNLADGAITVGIIIILLWNKTFFPKTEKTKSDN